MAKWHLNTKGDPGVCKAVQGKCPFGQHFENGDEARNIESNFAELRVNGELLPYADRLRDPELAKGNSKFISDYLRDFTDDEERRIDGLPTYGVTEHTPTGSLVSTHSANTLQANGETYVVDFSFAEVDPNAEWPYVGTPEAWRREVDKASVLGAPEKEPEPVDPRSLSIAVYPAGGPNPLLDKAVMEEPVTNTSGTKTRYLSVDQVRVAAIHYMVEKDGEPHIHSLETRQEYRNQGYMKKLLKELANEYGIEKVHSSGSMTNDGNAFTSHLTKPRPGSSHEVKWAEYGEAGKGTFSFVVDWVNGYAHS
jgi:hypothetical protein